MARNASAAGGSPKRAKQAGDGQGPGRPTRLNRASMDAVLTGIRAGMSHAQAARLANVAPDTVAEWLARGEGRDKRPATVETTEFAAAVRHAEAQAAARALASIQKAMGDDWKAAAWYLERKYPEEWGRRVVTADVTVTSDEKRRELLEDAKARAALLRES